MIRGMNAANIVAEYKREQAWKRIQREKEKCKTKQCKECQWTKVCEDKE